MRSGSRRPRRAMKSSEHVSQAEGKQARSAATRPVALFLPNLLEGGAERIAVYLANGLTARRQEVDIVVERAEGAYLADVSPEVRLVVLGARRAVRAVCPLARYLRSTRPKVLITTHLHSGVAAILARRFSRAGTRIIATIQTTLSARGELAGGPISRLERIAIKRYLVRADALVACSCGTADDFARFVGVPREGIRVIYNPAIENRIEEMAGEPVDHPWFAPGGPKVVLGVGRLTPPKDFFTVVRALALLQKSEEVRLVILAEGEDRGRLERLVQELRLENRVSMPGFVKNPFAYLARAHAFVFSSLREGLPTVLIEALALGVPIVATDCKYGPREILQDGRYGRLVPVGDAQAMADALRSALREPRQVVPPQVLQPFTLDGATDRYVELIAELTGR